MAGNGEGEKSLLPSGSSSSSSGAPLQPGLSGASSGRADEASVARGRLISHVTDSQLLQNLSPQVSGNSKMWAWSSRQGNSQRVGGSGALRNQGSSRDHAPSHRFRDIVNAFQATPSDFRVEGKEATLESLERWRKMTLVRNATRRFRYVANLSSRSQKGMPGQLDMAIAAASRFKLGMSESGMDGSVKEAHAEGFGLGATELEGMVQGHDAQSLMAYGGVHGVALALGVEDSSRGILGSPKDVEKRAKVFGTNTFPEKPEKGFFSFVWDACQDFTLIILAVCALVSLVVGIATEGLEGCTDALGILFSIMLVVLVTATSDYRQAQQFILLDKEKKKVFISVVRAGQRNKISIYDIVVGDCVVLSIGDIIPTDGILLTANSLVIDESSMTGESHPVHKSVSDSPFLLAGTKVQDGTATYLVTGVGMRTEWGNLLAKLSEEGEEETPLQVRLNGVATLVGRLGLYVAALVFLVLIGRLFLGTPFTPENWVFFVNKVVEAFAVSVTIVVVAVPEGLPLAVTLSLAFAMKKMMADKALVRKLAACETMGSATTICSDKTGTLTANQMSAVRMWMYDEVMEIPDHQALKLDISADSKALLLEAIFTNTSGDIQLDATSHEVKQILGTPTETAVLSLGVRLGGSFTKVRADSDCVRMDPFNSARKRMGVALRFSFSSSSSQGGAKLTPPVSRSGSFFSLAGPAPPPPKFSVRVHWKGAGEIVAASCNQVVMPTGQVVPLKARELEKVLHAFTADALRTLGFAYSDLSPSAVPPSVLQGEAWPEDVPLPDSGLTLLGLVGIQDPLRPSVPRAVALCKSAGIKVRMVTGDNLDTAKAIARGCGILTEDGEAVEGPVFRKMSPDQMRELIPKLQVMARSSPSDKLTLVRELRAMGEVVAVTGDGTNDAPALKESDIGLAMGIAGTEVAKESADIIILDDNFASIVNVARWGRSVYTNIQKFVQFQLTVNIVALTVNFVSACFTGSAPLNAVQLLWVNLIMDTLGALALATEPPTEELMKHLPVGRHAAFITNIMWRNLLGQALFQLLLLMLLPFLAAPLFRVSEDAQDAPKLMNTIIFNTFVYCQVFNEINSREMEKLNVFAGILRNPMFLSIVTFTALFQVVLVQYCCSFVGTVPLSLHQFLVCIGLGVIGLPVAVLVKLIPVPKAELSRAVTRKMFPASFSTNEMEEPLMGNGLAA